MTSDQQALLELIRIGMTGECSFTNVLLDADWSELVKLASKQGVTGLCMRGLEVLHEGQCNICPTEQKLQLYAQQQQTEKATKKIWKQCAEFTEAIKPVRIAVLKGIDYARYWPNRYWREFGDLDCVVVESGEFRGESSQLLDVKALEIGLKVGDDDYKHSHIYYKDLMVENHHSFTSFAGSQESLTLEKELRQLFAVSEEKILDAGLLTPSVDFTAVFMLAHAQNHFFYEGMNLRQILDWHFFLTKEGGNIDWNDVYGVLERTHLMPFTALMTRFCVQYFGLRTELDWSLCSDTLLNRFVEDLFSDKYNDNDRRWWMIVARMLNRYKRMWQFGELMRMPMYKAVWRTIAFSSFLHRKPKLE